MTTEELLIPRFKVIADYPNSLFTIGDILKYNNVLGDFIYYDEEGIVRITPKYYPAIFKLLNWWEERSIEELPEYVKNADGVYKTYFSVPTKVDSLWEWTVVHPTKEFGTEVMYIIDNKVEPSTKEEYEKINN